MSRACELQDETDWKELKIQFNTAYMTASEELAFQRIYLSDLTNEEESPGRVQAV